MSARRHVSFVGRTLLSQAVSIDHDWSLSASSDDILIAALGDLNNDDLEAASLLAYHLREAIGCLLIRRDMQARRVKADGGARRCLAAHVEDVSRCEGPARAVRIVDQTGAEVTGCVRHGAVALVSVEGARVYPGPEAREGDAIETFKAAQARRVKADAGAQR